MAEEHGSLVMLRLRNIDISDLGNYSCEAENVQGVARDYIELSGNQNVEIILEGEEARGIKSTKRACIFGLSVHRKVAK